MLAAATPRRFRPNSVVTHQGAPATELFLITKGRARHFFMTPDGQKILLLWLPQGEIFGSATLLAEQSAYRVSTETVKDTCAAGVEPPGDSDAGRTVSTDHGKRVVDRVGLPRLVAGRTRRAELRIRRSQRLAGVLVSLAPLLGRAVPGGVELDVTNEELASAAHITPFTTSRLLNEWQRHRAVIKRRGRVVLLAPRATGHVDRLTSGDRSAAHDSRLRWRNDGAVASCHPLLSGAWSP